MKTGTFNNTENRTCNYCNEYFEGVSGSKFANHVRWCKKNPNLDIQKQRDKSRETAFLTNNKMYGIKQHYLVECFKCKTPFIIERRDKTFLKKKKFFCSISCRNSRPHTEEDKIKIKNSICKNGMSLSEFTKDLWKDPEYSKKCLATNPRFTSIGERKLRDWFIVSFPNEEWTYGGSLSYKDISGISRDLYSHKLKICIEYDGVWHFEDILDQLKSKQDKDKALESWCLDNDYRLIRIKEDVFQKNSEEWIQKIRSEVLIPTSQIIKFY